MKAWRAARALVLGLIAVGWAAVPALAQESGTTTLISTPAETFAMAPGGVDMRTGRFAYNETDLTIGGEGGALTLNRTLTQPVPGHANPFANLSHNWDVMISELRINIENPAIAGPDYRITVHFGGRSQTYESYAHSVGFEQKSDGGYAPLTFTGDRASASVLYTYTAVDGTTVQFRALGGGDCSSPGTPRCAFVSAITEADGTVLTFDYTPSGSAFGAGGNQRLRSVISSRGYALLFEGNGNLVTKACVLNMAQTPLPANGLCPANAPASASYAYSAGASRLASATGPDAAVSGFTYGTNSMGFVRPGETAPWLTNTITLLSDEMGMTQEVIAHQSFADGSSYAYTFDRAPITNNNMYPAPVGGTYTNALGHVTKVPYAWEVLHGMNHPGSACNMPPCAPPEPDDFMNWVYQQTPGPETITDPLGRTTTFDYCDPIPAAQLPPTEHYRCVVVPLVAFTDPEGARTELQYDGHRNITRVTRHPRPDSFQPNGQPWPPIVTSAIYDTANPRSASKPLSMTDARGHTTNYTYAPAHGGMLTMTGPAPIAGAPRPQTRHHYAERRAWISSGGGYAPGPLLWLRTSTSLCRTSAVTADPNAPCAAGDEVRTNYDYGPDSGPNTLLLRGQTVTSTDLVNGSPVTTTLRTCYAYDVLGRRISETQPNANLASCPGVPPTTALPFTSSTRYDAGGRVTGTISPDPDTVGSGNPFLAVRNSYDAAGRLIKAETGSLATWQSEAVAPANWTGFTVEMIAVTQYDVMSRKLREWVREGPTRPVRRLTEYGYDLAGRPTCTAVRMNPAAFVFTLLPLPDACQPNAQGTGANDFGPDRITRTVHDEAGQRLQVRVGVGSNVEAAEATWAYNDNGQITTVIDGNGNRAELRYDGHGRQDRWTFPSTTRPTAYNDTYQTTALATAGSVNANDYEAYTYDANGNRTSLRKRDNAAYAYGDITYEYDALNRMTRKLVPQRPASHPKPLDPSHTRDVYYGYDLRNLQTYARFDSASGQGVTNAYDGFGRPLTSSINLGGTTRTLAYQHDRGGNRTRITHPDNAFFSTSYDGLGRPTWLTDPAGSGVVVTHYGAAGTPNAVGRPGASSGLSITGDGRLISLSHYFIAGLDVHWTFTHNPAGQIATTNRNNPAYAWGGHYAVNRNYTTDGLNRYTAAGNATFGYDLNGNLISDGSRTFTYDVENRLVGATGNLVLTYDPLGRLFRTSGGPSGTTTYLYDGDALIAEYSASGTLAHRYVHGNGADVPLVRYAGASTAAANRINLLADHQGSIIATSDNAANRLSINRYDEYGIPAAGNTGRFQYTGQIWLPDLGMYYYKARIMSPTLGRFLQTDPVGYEGGINLYAYVRNDPTNLTDPSGLTPAPGARLFEEVARAAWRSLSPDTQETVVEVLGTGAVIAGVVVDVVNTPVSPGPDASIAGVGIRQALRSALRREAREAPRGATRGPRAGRPFTPRGRETIDRRNIGRHGRPTCEGCSREVTPGRQHERGVTPPGNERQRDHIIPRSRGGDGAPDNGQVLCRDCNLRKGDRVED